LGQHFRNYRRKTRCIFVLVAIFSRATAAQVNNPPGKPPNHASRIGPGPAVIERGMTVYKDQCAICHFSDSDAKKIGPGLKGIFKREKFHDGGKVDDPSMEKWILSGGKNMPPFKSVLNTIQIRDLIAYLRTL
jgi:cytochrome c